ncbi:MAG: hypothetical protein AABW88_00660 [Nanoarchaeota archaeon]
MAKTKNKLKKSYYLVLLIFFALAVAVFDFVDYLIHGLSPEYSVPSRYFTNKLLYGTLYAFVSYLILKNKRFWTRVIGISAITGILLQVRYFIEGYSVEFVLEFMAIHFAILVLTLWLGFKYVLDPYLKRSN